MRVGASPGFDGVRGGVKSQESSFSSRASSRPHSQPPPHSSCSPYTPSSPLVRSTSIDPYDQHAAIKAEVEQHLSELTLVQDALRVRASCPHVVHPAPVGNGPARPKTGPAQGSHRCSASDKLAAPGEMPSRVAGRPGGRGGAQAEMYRIATPRLDWARLFGTFCRNENHRILELAVRRGRPRCSPRSIRPRSIRRD